MGTWAGSEGTATKSMGVQRRGRGKSGSRGRGMGGGVGGSVGWLVVIGVDCLLLQNKTVV